MNKCFVGDYKSAMKNKDDAQSILVVRRSDASTNSGTILGSILYIYRVVRWNQDKSYFVDKTNKKHSFFNQFIWNKKQKVGLCIVFTFYSKSLQPRWWPPASEGHTGLGHHGLVHGGKVLLNGDDQGGLVSVGTLVSMCLQVAPHKIVQGIKIRAAGRPAVLRDQVVSSGSWATWRTCWRHGRGPVLAATPKDDLLPLSWSKAGQCSPWPPNRCPCWPRGQSPRCEGTFLTFLEAIGALGARETTCLGSLVYVRARLAGSHVCGPHQSDRQSRYLSKCHPSLSESWLRRTFFQPPST